MRRTNHPIHSRSLGQAGKRNRPQPQRASHSDLPQGRLVKTRQDRNRQQVGRIPLIAGRFSRSLHSRQTVRRVQR
jgi:hypothetical protein